MLLVERLPRLVELTFTFAVLTFSRVLLPIYIIGGCTTDQVRFGYKWAGKSNSLTGYRGTKLPLFFAQVPGTSFRAGVENIFFPFRLFFFFFFVRIVLPASEDGATPKNTPRACWNKRGSEISTLDRARAQHSPQHLPITVERLLELRTRARCHETARAIRNNFPLGCDPLATMLPPPAQCAHDRPNKGLCLGQGVGRGRF